MIMKKVKQVARLLTESHIYSFISPGIKLGNERIKYSQLIETQIKNN